VAGHSYVRLTLHNAALSHLAAQGRTLIDGKATREPTASVEFRDYIKRMGSR
jgi:hypothetical protein